MGLISRFKDFIWNTAGQSAIPPAQQGIQFFENAGTTYWTAMQDPSVIGDWILKCPPLAYVLNRKAMAFVNGNTEVLNYNTDNYVRGANKKWEELLARPNPLQTDRQFRVELYTYIQAYGYCPVIVDQPAGFKDFSRVSAMWILPPNMCNIRFKTEKQMLYTKSWAELIDYIEFSQNGQTIRIDKNKVYFFTDISTNMDASMFPDSKLTPLKYPINNLIKSYEARGVIADRRGAVGILSTERADSISVLPMDENEKQALQEDYRRYGMTKDQWQLFITNIPMRYQQMAMPVKDMMLLEMEQADVRTICNALGYPFHLLSNEEGTTFSNMEAADSSLYQNSIIPESLHFSEQINECLHTKQNGVKIRYDYDWLPVMQADDKLKAEVRKRAGEGLIWEFNNNIITFNEVRYGLGLERVDGMDKYKYQLTEIYGTSEPIAQSATTGTVNNA